mmetsp:Transcript_10309/g.34106  ORF Transcript_10309/g.34106 Transcript_10309/m.34106 type:complete len:271 (-) Transcript_10309:41-853(-)
MTAIRPPGLTSRAAPTRIASSSSISRFTWMRSAWKTRAARLVSSLGGAPAASLTTRASWAVVVTGRAATMARASMRDARSSPCRHSTSAISEGSHSLTMVAAVSAPPPPDWSIRMSSGPSKRKEKPRAALSIWCELTPRSSSRPDRSPSVSARPSPRKDGASRSSARGKLPKLVCRRVAEPDSTNGRNRRPACLNASTSRSAHTRRPPEGPISRRMASECPPPPSVQSAYTPDGSLTSQRTVSSRRTGTWYSSQCDDATLAHRRTGGPAR